MDDQILSTLERWVLQDRRPVTARLLAVAQNVNVDKARSHMKHFLESRSSGNNDGRLHAHWQLRGVITGLKTEDSQKTLQESMDLDGEQGAPRVTREAVLNVDDEKLEEAKLRFVSAPRVCLYALSPPLSKQPSAAQKVSAVAQLSTVKHDLKNTLEYVKAWDSSDRGAALGAIKAPDDVILTGNSSMAIGGLVADIKPLNAKPAPLKPESANTSISKPKAKEQIAKADAPTQQKKAVGTKSSTKKQSAPSKKSNAMDVDDEDEEDDGPIGYADVKAETSEVAVESGGAATKRADAGSKAAEQEEKRRRRKQELIDMMDEDRDGNADPEVGEGSSASTSMMGGNQQIGQTQSAPKKDKDGAKSDGEQAAKGEKRRVRKQRKTTRKETTKENGYRVTRDVDVYESYSSFESSGEENLSATSKAAAAEKKVATKSGRQLNQTNKKDERKATDSLIDNAQTTDATSKPDQDEAAAASTAQAAPPKVESKADTSSSKAKIPTPAVKSAPALAASKKSGGSGTGQQKLSSFFSRKA